MGSLSIADNSKRAMHREEALLILKPVHSDLVLGHTYQNNVVCAGIQCIIVVQKY